MIKVVIFDLGGVLFTNGTKKFVEYLNTTYGLDKEEVKSLLDKGEIPDAYREGKIRREEFWDKVQKGLKLTENVDTLEKRWIDGYELIEETRDIIQTLSKKYNVFFLSDNVKERVEAVDKKFNFLSWFTDGVFSHEVGMRRPNPEIYKIALEKAGVEPVEALFVDDKESALLPANEMGMATILFETPEKLRTSLKVLHVL